MSAPAVAEKIGWQSRRVRRLPPAAAAYAGAVAGLALVAAAVSVVSGEAPTARQWLDFALLLPLAIAAPHFTVSIGRNHGFHTGPVFLVAAALVLPPALVVAVAVGQHLPLPGVRDRPAWYIQVFNTANYTLSALAAWAAAHALDGTGDLHFALAGLAAAAAFVAVNHALLATMLHLGRGHSYRETGLFSVGSLGTEFVLALLGVAIGAFALVNPWLLPAVIAPLVLAHRSLSTVAALHESEERFRTMFESAPTAVMLFGADGTILATNRSAQALVGYDESEMIGRSPAHFRHPDDAEEGNRLFGEAIRGERDGYRREARYVHKDGSTVVADLAMAVVRDGDGNIDYVIGMAEDVTERRVLEEQLRQSQKLEAVGRLAGGVAHDFNNMLTAIGGYTALALEHAEPGTTLHGDLDEIRKAADRAGLLTRQLLAFSRKQVLEPEPLDLNEIAGEMQAMLRPLIGADIEFTTSFAPDLGTIEADPGQLQQVLMNLVVNARDAMPDGGTLSLETANVEVDGTGDGSIEPGRYVTLTVRDTGEGMDEATLRQIFEPFFTTKGSGKGTGLGLATVYGIVKQSGGYVEVESELGVGSAFRIYLRRVEDARPLAAPAPVATPPAAAPEPTTGTVLVVEDEEVVRGLVCQVLENEGLTPLVARDGEEALELAGRQHVDVLLTDLMMPKLGGRELAEQLRRTNPGLKVVYMSGYPEGGILSDGVLPPDTAFLSKPFTFAELAEKVRGLLRTPAASVSPN
jgi:PAS domain S-box-containing protein